MQRVREEIGPDAVIVSNHRVAGGVEVVAAHEHEYEAAQQEFKRKRAAEKSRTPKQGKLKSNLAEELRKAQARIATAQEGGVEPKQKNRQMGEDDAELSDILDTLKQRQRSRPSSAMRGFDQPQRMAQPKLDPSRQEAVRAPVNADTSLDVKSGIDDEQQVIQSLQSEIESLNLC